MNEQTEDTPADAAAETEAAEVVAPQDDRRHARRWWQSPRRVVLVYTLLFVATEAVGAFVGITAQATLDALFAFVAINHAVFGFRTQRAAGVVMAALFTSRLVALTLPATDISLPTRAAILGIAGCIIGYLALWVFAQDIKKGRTDEGYTLKKPFISRPVTIALTVLSGFPLGWAAFALLKPNPLPIDPLFGGTSLPWVLAAGALTIAAFSEELLYRRLVAAMVQYTGQSQTPLISGVLFGATYLPTKDLGLVALAAFTGIIFAGSCERTGTLKPVVAAHAIINIMVFLILP